MGEPASVLITGGSSGIGAALALEYAGSGRRLLLTGRDVARLEGVAAACRAKGADVAPACIDVTDTAALGRWVAARASESPIDLAIANAGISAGTGGGGETEAQARRIFAVNVDGVIGTVHAVLPGMLERNQGQIALMSSLAGFRGMPGAPAYCGSKAAVRVYGEALRADLAGKGIGVSVICPGFVRSPMTAVNPFPMPFLMDADKAARIIRNGLARNRARIAFPLPMVIAVQLLTLVPSVLLDPILARAPRKPG